MSEDRIDQLLAVCLGGDHADWNGRIDAECAAYPELSGELRRRYRRLIELGMIEAPPDGFERLGRYRLLRKLGRGAMGIVFLAFDSELGRQVALKLVRPELLGSDRARQRFRREAEVAARLDHPGLCAVLGAGEIDGRPYLAMAWLQGETLEERLRLSRAGNRGVLATSDAAPGGMRAVDLRPALQLVEQLARALEAAHDAGLVHRDLKPANVMVTAGGPVLMDFGLARDTDADAAQLTQSQQVLGTPVYMAPEQIRGAAVDRRADVWALGAVLYECLTLRPPFAGQNRDELYRNILAADPIDLRRLQPAATRELATVVHTALHKDLNGRYQTAGQLADDLRAVLEGRPTRARPPGPLLRAWRLARRHRALASVAVVVLLGLVSSLSLLVRSLAAERRSRAVADILRADAARNDPARAFAILEQAFALAPEPEVVAAVNVQLAELQQQELVRPLTGRAEALMRSPSGRWLLVSGLEIKAALHRADGSFWCELPWPIVPQTPAVAFSPDEDELIVARATDDGHQLMRCRLDGAVLEARPFGEPTGRGPNRLGTARAVAWARDSIAVSHVRDDGRAQVVCYDATSSSRRWAVTVREHCRGVAFAADGRLLVPAGFVDESGVLQVEFAIDDTAADPVTHVLPLGERVVIGSHCGVRCFDASGRKVLDQRRPPGPLGAMLKTVEAAADGALLLAFQDGVVQVIEPDGRVEPWTETRTVWAARMSGDGRILTCGWGGLATIRDRRGQLLHHWQGHQTGAFAEWMADGERVFSTSWDGTVRMWTPGVFPHLPMRSGFPRAVLCRTQALLVLASDDGRLLALDAQGALVDERRIGAGFRTLHAHRDGRSVWIGTFDANTLQRWEPGTSELGPALQLPGNDTRGPVGLAHMASDDLLLSYGWDGNLRRQQAVGGNSIVAGTPASQVAAVPGGTMAVSMGEQGPLRFHDQHGVVLGEGQDGVGDAAVGKVVCIAVSRDGTFAVVGRTDGSVTRWDLQSRQCTARWRIHRERVRDIAISDDGRLLASVTTAGHLLIYRSSDAEPVLESHLDRESLESVAFFGNALVTTGWGDSGLLRWWWWDPEVLEGKLALLRRHVQARLPSRP